MRLEWCTLLEASIRAFYSIISFLREAHHFIVILLLVPIRSTKSAIVISSWRTPGEKHFCGTPDKLNELENVEDRRTELCRKRLTLRLLLLLLLIEKMTSEWIDQEFLSASTGIVRVIQCKYVCLSDWVRAILPPQRCHLVGRTRKRERRTHEWCTIDDDSESKRQSQDYCLSVVHILTYCITRIRQALLPLQCPSEAINFMSIDLYFMLRIIS